MRSLASAVRMAGMANEEDYDSPHPVPLIGDNEQGFGFEDSDIPCPNCTARPELVEEAQVDGIPFMTRFFFESGYVKLECPVCDHDITEAEPLPHLEHLEYDDVPKPTDVDYETSVEIDDDVELL
jgi:hypothetical protein